LRLLLRVLRGLAPVGRRVDQFCGWGIWTVDDVACGRTAALS